MVYRLMEWQHIDVWLGTIGIALYRHSSEGMREDISNSPLNIENPD
jgi:hypothetical protein